MRRPLFTWTITAPPPINSYGIRAAASGFGNPFQSSDEGKQLCFEQSVCGPASLHGIAQKPLEAQHDLRRPAKPTVPGFVVSDPAGFANAFIIALYGGPGTTTPT